MSVEVIMPWTFEPSMANGRWLLGAAIADAPSPASGYRIYAIGGWTEWGPIATVEAYDTLAKGWSVIAPMMTARGGLAAASNQGRIHALGGDDDVNIFATHEIYDPAAGAWASAPPMPTARTFLAAVTGHDGLIYTIGGAGTDDGAVGTVEAFDPTTNAWTTRPSMPTPRYQLAAVTGPDGLIYAIGGYNNLTAPGTTLDTVEVFNPATNVWTTAPSFPVPINGIAAAVGPDGLIYVFGGWAGGASYSYDPASAGPWVVQPSLLTIQNFPGGVTGPDGLIYAVGGTVDDTQALSTVEAFSVAATLAAPDPYIGNGTYQSPDIILLDSSGNPIPVGGAPSGAWDTLLQPNTYYGIQAVVYNDSNVAAGNTIVRFWHFPGGVGTAGSQIDMQTVTVPPNGSVVVSSASPFQSGGVGQHECVAVSVANSRSVYFNVDPTTAAAVMDPTIAHPIGSGNFGSAWRNTNSVVMGAGSKWVFPFEANLEGQPASVKIVVTATKVPVGWDRAGEIAELRSALESAGVGLNLPWFLVPAVRLRMPPANLELKIQLPQTEGESAGSTGTAEKHVTVNPGLGTRFTVTGTIPYDARAGDVFLVDVAAHYPNMLQVEKAALRYLQVIYVK
jgi:hypothetical protein